jgi:hypothetical protein
MTTDRVWNAASAAAFSGSGRIRCGETGKPRLYPNFVLTRLITSPATCDSFHLTVLNSAEHYSPDCNDLEYPCTLTYNRGRPENGKEAAVASFSAHCWDRILPSGQKATK